ncbi:hypothetical protein D3C77_640250 [compost metagenome]
MCATKISIASTTIPVTAKMASPHSLRPFFIIAVIPNMYCHDTVSFECHDFINSTIQEITIMGYYKHCSREFIQISFKHAQGLNIQVISRFIQQQNVWRPH